MSFELITEDDLFENWGLVEVDGSSWLEFSAVVNYPVRNVWSIIEPADEDGRLYALPGFHVVNMVGYIVTTRQWTDPCQEAVYSEGR